jgi:hypothetical protein
MMKIIPAILLAVLIAGCASAPASPPPAPPPPPPSSSSPSWHVSGKYQSQYPPYVVNAFMSTCTGQDKVAVATCTCGMDYFEQHVPYQRFVQDGIQAGEGLTPPDAAASVQACKPAAGGGGTYRSLG